MCKNSILFVVCTCSTYLSCSSVCCLHPLFLTAVSLKFCLENGISILRIIIIKNLGGKYSVPTPPPIPLHSWKRNSNLSQKFLGHSSSFKSVVMLLWESTSISTSRTLSGAAWALAVVLLLSISFDTRGMSLQQPSRCLFAFSSLSSVSKSDLKTISGGFWEKAFCFVCQLFTAVFKNMPLYEAVVTSGFIGVLDSRTEMLIRITEGLFISSVYLLLELPGNGEVINPTDF